MRFLFILVVLSVFAAHSQEVRLEHYQRTKSFDGLPLPTDEYKSSEFGIIFPDSLYNAANIRIKKANFKGYKSSFQMILSVEEKNFTQIRIFAKGKRKIDIVFKLIETACSDCKVQRATGTQTLTYKQAQIKLTVSKIAGKYEFLLSV